MWFHYRPYIKFLSHILASVYTKLKSNCVMLSFINEFSRLSVFHSLCVIEDKQILRKNIQRFALSLNQVFCKNMYFLKRLGVKKGLIKSATLIKIRIVMPLFQTGHLYGKTR